MLKFEVSKSLRKNLLMISGEESTLRDQTMRSLVTEASGGEDFDFESFFADGSAPIQWLASAGTTPFLSPRRTVVVRNLCRSDAHKEFKPSALPEHALLVLVADDEAGDQDRQRKMDTSRLAWEKAVVAAGGEVLKCSIDPKDLLKSIKDEAMVHGKKITDQAALVLREMTGESFSRASEELEKLAFYVGEQPQITDKDVRAVVIASPDWNVWKLVDAITRRDHSDALRQLKNLVGSNPRVEEVVFQFIFPTLSKQFRLLWQGRAYIEAKVSPATAPSTLTSLMPEKSNLSREKDWVQNRVMQNARSLSFPAQARCLAAVADADARMKGLLPAFSAIDTLERMVLEMIEAAEG